MTLLHIFILAVIQGLAELLPVSSSAHVIVGEKLMGMDPTSPVLTLLLVVLHTGTMFAVLCYFWKPWARSVFESWASFKRFARLAIYATFFTGIVGYPIILGIEKTFLRHYKHADIELIFGNLTLISIALACAGLLILISGLRNKKSSDGAEMGSSDSVLIGAVQGLCLPFRGFSRSGATISTALLRGVNKTRAEEFSFALAIILTPPALARELWRVFQARQTIQLHVGHLSSLILPMSLGLVFSFLAGLAALAWLSRWLENGRWYLFGIYCLVASAVVFSLHLNGW